MISEKVDSVVMYYTVAQCGTLTTCHLMKKRFGNLYVSKVELFYMESFFGIYMFYKFLENYMF